MTMAKQTFYYRTTPLRWAAAQARGYLLESSSVPKGSWTHLYSTLKPNYGPAYFMEGGALVEATVHLSVQYEKGANDWGLPELLCATAPIPLADITVL